MRKTLGHYKRVIKKNYFYLFNHEKVKITDNYYLMDEPNYGNLGDQAIAYAEHKFIEKNLDIGIQGIDIDNTISSLMAIIRKTNTPILLQGGGNLGDRYLSLEELRRFVILKAKKRKVIVFPQTIDFSAENSTELRRTMKAYSQNNNLILVAREPRSYDVMKRLFDNEVIMTPDIVLSLNLPDVILNKKRTGVITLFRHDSEQWLGEDEKKKIMKKLYKKFDRVTVSDTHVGKERDSEINAENREEYLFQLWRKIASHKLVITDRLHGMIFAYITKTPCIVIKNANFKISETYNAWLRQCNYIEMLTDYQDIDMVINKLLSVSPIELDLTDKFLPLIRVLKNS